MPIAAGNYARVAIATFITGVVFYGRFYRQDRRGGCSKTGKRNKPQTMSDREMGGITQMGARMKEVDDALPGTKFSSNHCLSYKIIKAGSPLCQAYGLEREM